MKASEFKQAFPEVPNSLHELATANSIELSTQYLVQERLKADFYQYMFEIAFTLYGMYKVKVIRVQLAPHAQSSVDSMLLATVTFKGTKL